MTGDLNVAPTALDIHNPKGNLKSAGAPLLAAGARGRAGAVAGHAQGAEVSATTGGRASTPLRLLPRAAQPAHPPAPSPLLACAGFTPEERASFADELVGGCGLVDCFRAQHPDAVAYTYWSYR